MRKRLIAGSLALIALSAAAGVATAQQAPTLGHGPEQGRERGRHHAQARIDTDGDSRVSQAEFVQARVARLAKADTDGNGTVTPEEVSARMQARVAERAGARFESADTDKDGAISRAEFEAAFKARGDNAGAGRHGRDPGAEGRGPRRMAEDGARHGGRRTGGRDHAGRSGRMTQPVVIAEVQARASETFARLDTDHDGFLSSAEQQAGRAAMREKFQERRAARRAERGGSVNPASPSTPASE